MSHDVSEGYLRSREMLARGDSRLLIVDVQQKLVSAVPVAERLLANCRSLIQAAQILNIRVDATEQYPKGLGGTHPDLAGLLSPPPEKVRFSCAEVLDWGPAAASPSDPDQVVVAGMEAHVCVAQTALDLIAQGYQVYVVADAVASRHKLDWKMALRRLADAGAVVTTTEAVLFEWCEVAGTAEFKEISRLVQNRPA